MSGNKTGFLLDNTRVLCLVDFVPPDTCFWNDAIEVLVAWDVADVAFAFFLEMIGLAKVLPFSVKLLLT